MKKFLVILSIIFLFILLIFLINFQITNTRSKDLVYAVEHYSTKSLHNRNRLDKITEIFIDFQDSKVAVVKVTGNLKDHREATFKLLLWRNAGQVWKVIHQYNFRGQSLVNFPQIT